MTVVGSGLLIRRLTEIRNKSANHIRPLPSRKPGGIARGLDLGIGRSRLGVLCFGISGKGLLKSLKTWAIPHRVPLIPSYL